MHSSNETSVEVLKPAISLDEVKLPSSGRGRLFSDPYFNFALCHEALCAYDGVVSSEKGLNPAVSVSFLVGGSKGTVYESSYYRRVHYVGLADHDGLHLRIEDGVSSAWFKGSAEQRSSLGVKSLSLEQLNSPTIWDHLQGAYTAFLEMERKFPNSKR